MPWFDGTLTGWPKVVVNAAFLAQPSEDVCIRGTGVRGTSVRGGRGLVTIPMEHISSVSWTRGRGSPVDAANPGQATVVLYNAEGKGDGDYDPTNLNGPYVADDATTLTTLGTFEANLEGWAGGGTVPPTVTRDSTHAHGGTWAAKIAWATGGIFPQAAKALTNLEVGQGYRLVGWAYVPTGSPAVRWAVGGIPTVGDSTTTNNAFEQIEFSFIATATTMSVQIWPVSAATVGQTAWIDDLTIVERNSLVDLGTAVTIQAERPLGMLWDRFTGEIADVELNLDIVPTVTLTVADGLENLGRVQLAIEPPQFDGDLTGERINHLADRANWPADARVIDDGTVTVAPTTLGASALELIRRVEASEFGLLFIDGHGDLVFYDRHRAETASQSVVVQVALSDSSTPGQLGMVDLVLSKSREQIFNDVHVTRDPDPAQDPELTGATPGDAPQEQIAQDTTSISTYGTLSFPTEVGQVLTNDPDALGLAQGLRRLYAKGQIRIREVTINALNQRLIDEGMWPAVLGLDLLDRISVFRNYGANVIGPKDLLIQSITEEITAAPSWTLRFSTSEPPPAVHYCTRGEGVRGTDLRGW